MNNELRAKFEEMSLHKAMLLDAADVAGISVGKADGSPYPTIAQLYKFAIHLHERELTRAGMSDSDEINHPRALGETRDEIELFLRDAYACGCRASQIRSPVTAMEYATKHAPKLRAALKLAPSEDQAGAG